MSSKTRAFLKGLWVTAFKPAQSDFSNFFDSFVSVTDDLGDNTVLVQLPSAAPVGINLPFSTVLGRKASGNIVAITFSDLIAGIGGMDYTGVWNANTNSPTLVSGTGTKGAFYKVSVAGTTTIDGVSSWAVGDMIVFNGTTWDKIDNTDAVSSVFGRTGAVVLLSGDVTGALGFTPFNATNVDTDNTLTANSDAKVSSQKAIKAYIGTAISGKQNTIGYTPAVKLGKNISTPITGGIVTLVNLQYNVINPTGDISTLTLNMPATPADGDIVEIKFTHAVTTATYVPAVSGAPASPAANTLVRLMYDSATTTWY